MIHRFKRTDSSRAKTTTLTLTTMTTTMTLEASLTSPSSSPSHRRATRAVSSDSIPQPPSGFEPMTSTSTASSFLSTSKGRTTMDASAAGATPPVSFRGTQGTSNTTLKRIGTRTMSSLQPTILRCTGKGGYHTGRRSNEWLDEVGVYTADIQTCRRLYPCSQYMKRVD